MSPGVTLPNIREAVRTSSVSEPLMMVRVLVVRRFGFQRLQNEVRHEYGTVQYGIDTSTGVPRTER